MKLRWHLLAALSLYLALNCLTGMQTCRMERLPQCPHLSQAQQAGHHG